MFLNSSPVSSTILGAMENNDCVCVFLPFPFYTQVMLDPQFKHLSLTLALPSFSLFLAELFQLSQHTGANLNHQNPAYTGSQEKELCHVQSKTLARSNANW